MSQTLHDILKSHKEWQEKLVHDLGTKFAHPEMVFTSSLGNYKDRSLLNTSFKRFLKGTDFDFLTLHSLRHCNATLLLNSDVDLKVVSEHLGHSQSSMKLDTYSHVLQELQEEAMQIISDKFLDVED